TTSTFTVEDTTAPVFVDTDCDTTVELDFDPNNGPGDKDGFTYLGEYEGHYYYITTETMSATDGNILVGNNGGYMATITDADENQWIYDAAVASNGGNNIRFWIGLTDVAEEGVFLWMDGTTFDYENWHNGEPNNRNGNEHCVELGRFNSSTWNDEPCTNQKYILMEVDGASLKEEAAYTDACAGDGTVTDYSDVISSSTTEGTPGTIQFYTDANGWYIDYTFTGYDINGYPEYSGVFNWPYYGTYGNGGSYPLSYNHDLGRWEGYEYDTLLYSQTTNSNIPSCDLSDWVDCGCLTATLSVINCSTGQGGDEEYTLVRTFTATDGCNESECSVTYTWTVKGDTPTEVNNTRETNSGNAELYTATSMPDQSQAAPGEGEDMGVELDFLAYPVPFDRDVNVKFNFEFDTDVTIEVHDTRGLLVKSMTLNNVRANTEIKKSFDLSRAGDQLFYITVTTNQGSVTKKAVSSNMKRR
ncbi:hypothetical protein N9R53_01460, partial [Flavobacteriaceae bacterium]|nr:hypothetical protein [Flavobacteriaceae bacterium]